MSKVGDVFFLRASLVHSLDSGLCMLEPQEPTDWSILAEWEDYPYTKEEASLGLGWDVALSAADLSALPKEYLEKYVICSSETIREENGNKESRLIPNEAKEFFDLMRLTINTKISMPNVRGFYCAICTQGKGKIVGPFGDMQIKRGKSVFIKASLPSFDFINTGDKTLEIICCYPPVVL